MHVSFIPLIRSLPNISAMNSILFIACLLSNNVIIEYYWNSTLGVNRYRKVESKPFFQLVYVLWKLSPSVPHKWCISKDIDGYSLHPFSCNRFLLIIVLFSSFRGTARLLPSVYVVINIRMSGQFEFRFFVATVLMKRSKCPPRKFTIESLASIRTERKREEAKNSEWSSR